jgi:AcrR family transcriptional regulator
MSRQELVQGKRRTTPEVRQALLDAAAHVFSKRGYGGGTTNEIALEAGTTEKAIYRHFGSKAELFSAAVVRPFLEMLRDYTVAFQRELPTGDSKRVVGAWIRELYTHLSDNREAVLALISSSGDPEAREAVGMAIARMDQMFDEQRQLSLRLYETSDDFRPEPGQLWARLVTGMLISITALEPIVLSKQAAEHNSENLIQAVCDLVFYGVYSDEST